MKKGQKRWNWRERVKDEDLCKETGEETKEERKRKKEDSSGDSKLNVLSHCF